MHSNELILKISEQEEIRMDKAGKSSKEIADGNVSIWVQKSFFI